MNREFWEAQRDMVTDTSELFGEKKSKENPEEAYLVNDKSKEPLPEGVHWIKNVVELSKYGVPLPEFYFSNISSNVAYILGEDKEYPVKIEPGQVYIYRIDGANKKTGVYKIANFGRLFADKDGNIKPSGPVANLWKALDSYTDTGPKDEKWIKEREAEGDMKWVRLYNTIK